MSGTHREPPRTAATNHRATVTRGAWYMARIVAARRPRGTADPLSGAQPGGQAAALGPAADRPATSRGVEDAGGDTGAAPARRRGRVTGLTKPLARQARAPAGRGQPAGLAARSDDPMRLVLETSWSATTNSPTPMPRLTVTVARATTSGSAVETCERLSVNTSARPLAKA